MNERDPSRLSIAIQKSGRLTEPSLDLLRNCDFDFSMTERLDFASVRNFPIDIMFERSRDIPNVLLEDNVDLGIVGNDIIRESQNPLIRLGSVGFEPCKVGLAVREDFTYTTPSNLNGKIVVTSYPHITQEFFDAREVKIILHVREGSAELPARLGEADAAVDAIDTGESLRTNGLKLVEVLFSSSACLVASPALREQSQKRDFVDEFLLRSFSYLRPKYFRWIATNISRELKEEILGILEPYSSSPTASPCENKDVVDLAAVIPKIEYWDIIKQLRARGARKTAELAMKRLIPDADDPDLKKMIEAIYP